MKKAVLAIILGVLAVLLAQPVGIGIADLVLLIAGDMSLDAYLAVAGVSVIGLFAAGFLAVVGGVVLLVVRKIRGRSE